MNVAATSDHLCEQLHQEGFLLLAGLFGPEAVELIKNEACSVSEGGDSGVHVFYPPAVSEHVLAACLDAQVARILRQGGLASPEFLSVKTVVKDAERRFASPWHQDRPYWGGQDKYSLWIALDDCCRENGCLRVIPGSHREGFIEHSSSDDNKFQNRLDADALNENDALDVCIKAGDAVLFHDCLLHASYPNSNLEERWSLIATYRDAEIGDTSTIWEHPVGM